ncbi:MAG: SDR family oxidoreductase [Thermomicrobiales bacterium]
MGNALAGKVAVVTGASSGIGYATAKVFVEEGVRVVVAARRRDALEALVDEITAAGGEAIAIAGDVRDETLAQSLVDAAVQQFGGLDVAFNNAGIVGEMGGTLTLSRAGWDETIETNLTSAFLGAKYQLPAMLDRGGGSLIFTSSFVGYSAGMPGMAAYAASKAGLIGFTQALAVEYGAQGIRVNAILPGGTDTPSNARFDMSQSTGHWIGDDRGRERGRCTCRHHPYGRVGIRGHSKRRVIRISVDDLRVAAACPHPLSLSAVEAGRGGTLRGVY